MSEFFDDLGRDVFCILGTPVDNTSMKKAVGKIQTALAARSSLLIATPNINFIVNALCDEEFKKSLIFSDLCLPDGMWLVRLGRLLGVPLAERVAGADLLEALKSRAVPQEEAPDPLKVYFFGGSDVAGRQAREAINARETGLRCVGAANPGFGSVEEMSEERLLSAVNAADADFLLVALGAKKGQMWLHANHARLTVPLRAHLGATINFYAGAIKRAPPRWQAWGLEWAWRIKEEPALWRRYAYDGSVMALMLLYRVAPLLLWSVYLRARRQWIGEGLTLDERTRRGRRVIALGGALTARNAVAIVAALRAAIRADEDLVLDLSGARAVDARFAGLLWMLHKTQTRRGRTARIESAPAPIRWLLALYGFQIAGEAPQGDPIAIHTVPLGATE
jgi:N-acetylglucosaminyldiphosphoundecaprenol N-acetyl-beta-D-mannosaminyltransferase